MNYRLVVEFAKGTVRTKSFESFVEAMIAAQDLDLVARWKVIDPSGKVVAVSPRDGVSENAQKAGRKLASSLTPAQRKAKAQAAARARWGKK